jgi:hypothetical protein
LRFSRFTSRSTWRGCSRCDGCIVRIDAEEGGFLTADGVLSIGTLGGTLFALERP